MQIMLRCQEICCFFVKVLASVYGQWTSGGGVNSINVNEVVFQIPPYFACTAKNFSVVEGIGLSNDPKYCVYHM
jgi:hypothetical protein